MSFRRAFTLIEILLVVTIISLVVSITYPVGIKLLKKFNSFLSKVEKQNAERKKQFEKFLRDE
jgi:prepilin-type N-terminal cleavage/methylation domain-containing protein